VFLNFLNYLSSFRSYDAPLDKLMGVIFKESNIWVKQTECEGGNGLQYFGQKYEKIQNLI